MGASTTSVANILVADDTVENLRLLVTMLGGQGYEVRPVGGGRQALQAAERDPPDLILLDINMPDLNGYEVCAELKARERLRDIPVIFLTAMSEVADKVRAFEVGGVDYITKPFQLEEVHARVRTHLALRRARLDLSESLTQLQRLERLRDDLVHMIVHDMRSPLMALSMHLRLAEKDAHGTLSANALEDFNGACEAAEVVTRMTNDLLDVSRLESGGMPLKLEKHDLGTLIGAAHERLLSFERGRNIELDVESSLVIECDGELIRRVLQNLLSNAIRHTPSRGCLFISAKRTRDGARVAVGDEGPGVPVEARERIFEKFETLSARTQKQYHSVGLGLAFCKLAVRAHGGRIGVDAREPVGSSFWFELTT